MTTKDPFTVIANYLGCTPADVAAMTLEDIAAAKVQVQRDLDQARADLAWLDAAGAVAANPHE